MAQGLSHSIEEEYSIRVDEPSSGVLYVGEALIGSLTSTAVWKIKKLTTVGAITSVLWADGNDAFDNIWDNRTSITYS